MDKPLEVRVRELRKIELYSRLQVSVRFEKLKSEYGLELTSGDLSFSRLFQILVIEDKFLRDLNWTSDLGVAFDQKISGSLLDREKNARNGRERLSDVDVFLNQQAQENMSPNTGVGLKDISVHFAVTVDEFINLFKDSKIIATGRTESNASRISISSYFWTNLFGYFGVRNNTTWVGSPNLEDSDLYYSQLGVRILTATESKKPSGRKDTFLWNAALDRAMIMWLDEGAPKLGKDFAAFVERGFEEIDAKVPKFNTIERRLAEQFPKLWDRASGD